MTHRRDLIREGFILLHYIQSSPPRKELVRLYARVIEKDAVGSPLELSKINRLCPYTIAFIEPIVRKTELSKRLHLAGLIIEAGDSRALKLYDYVGWAMFASLLHFISISVVETITFPFRFFSEKVAKHD